jgi:hypothetical protein
MNVSLSAGQYLKCYMRNLCVSSCHQIATGHFIPIVMAEGRLGQETATTNSSLGRYVFGSEISYNKAPPRLPGLGC